jgi:phosphopantothenoylcysteine decarboxylase/phosphopantothenate--cysteine ligase
MLEADELHAALDGFVQPKVLAGKRMIVTAGPTFEAIDPVRGITNLSSGKMGFAIARAAADAGAMVTLVAGPTTLATPAGVRRIDVQSAAQMAAAVMHGIDACDIFIAVAAVADYTPEHTASRKIKKSGQDLNLTLKATTDILATVAARPDAPFCVGFAAESHDVDDNAESKRKRKRVPLVVANRAQDAFGRDDNEVTLLDDVGRHPLPRMDKLALARRLAQEIADRLGRRAPG